MTTFIPESRSPLVWPLLTRVVDLLYHLVRLLVHPEAGIHLGEITDGGAHVVGEEEGIRPDGLDPALPQVLQPVQQPRGIADPVAVRVLKRGDPNL